MTNCLGFFFLARKREVVEEAAAGRHRQVLKALKEKKLCAIQSFLDKAAKTSRIFAIKTFGITTKRVSGGKGGSFGNCTDCSGAARISLTPLAMIIITVAHSVFAQRIRNVIKPVLTPFPLFPPPPLLIKTSQLVNHSTIGVSSRSRDLVSF